MVARWADGDQWEIPELSVEKYEAQQTSTKKKHKVYFEGEHKDTNHKLKVHYRADRENKHLMSLYEQKAQVLGVLVSKFPDVDAAGEWMAKIAERYASGEIPRDASKKVRDEQLAIDFPDQGPKRKAQCESRGRARGRGRGKGSATASSSQQVGGSSGQVGPAESGAGVGDALPDDDIAEVEGASVHWHLVKLY